MPKRKFEGMSDKKFLKTYHAANCSMRTMSTNLKTDRFTIKKEFIRRGLEYKGYQYHYNQARVKKEKIEEKVPLDIRLLTTLKNARIPIIEADLVEQLDTCKTKLFSVIKQLNNAGYDIKKIYSKDETRYSLVRFGTFEEEQLYKELGKIELPAIISSDWHIGSKTFSQQAFNEMIEDCEEYGIKNIINAGDLLQGRGVHRLEAQDISLWNIDEQVSELGRLLELIPKGTKVHCVMGNHEEKLKGNVQVGYDCLKASATQFKKLKYYGHVAKLGIEDTDKTMLLMHSSGGLTYARSYRLERIYGELFEKPNIIIIGHDHRLNGPYSLGPTNIGYQSGTLQRENSFLLNKGHMSVVGWHILLEYNPCEIKSIMRRPRTF